MGFNIPEGAGCRAIGLAASAGHPMAAIGLNGLTWPNYEAPRARASTAGGALSPPGLPCPPPRSISSGPNGVPARDGSQGLHA
eukprot:3480687-Pyramimonas_sp.AAC.1